MKTCAYAALAVLAVGGCTTAPPVDRARGFDLLTRPSVKTDFAANRNAMAGMSPAQRAAEEQRINDAITAEIKRTMEGCSLVLNDLASKSESGAKSAFWLQMSGLVLGSVFAPAAIASSASAHRVAIAAASGWAGATNLAGESLRAAGLSGSAVAETRNQVAAAFKTQMATALNASNDPQVRLNAALAARGECIWYAVAVPGAMPALPDPAAKGGQPGSDSDTDQGKGSDAGKGDKPGGTGKPGTEPATK